MTPRCGDNMPGEWQAQRSSLWCDEAVGIAVNFLNMYYTQPHCYKMEYMMVILRFEEGC